MKYPRSKVRPWRLLTCSICLSALLAGCAGEKEEKATGPRTFEAPPEREINLSGLAEEEQAALIRRVEEKWRAMEQWDFAAVYDYTTPNYREIFSKTMFLNKFSRGVRWELTGVDIIHYDAEASVASVAVRVMSESTKRTSLASSIGPAPNTVKEHWFLIDGEWWNNAK